KMKIGFCSGPEYLYLRHAGSATGSQTKAYYIFEQTTAFWEELFAGYQDSVPQYIQALYVNDLNWKITADVLFPYHYEGENFDRAISRLSALLDRVDDAVIMDYPNVDGPRKGYLLSLKPSAALSVQVGCGGNALQNNGQPVYLEKNAALVINRFKVRDSFVYIDSFLRSPIFSFCEKPECYAYLTGKNIGDRVAVELTRSNWDFYNAKVRTNTFWRLQYKWDYNKYDQVTFSIVIGGVELPLRIETASTTPFSTAAKRTSLFRNGRQFTIIPSGFTGYPASEKTEKKFLSDYRNNLFFNHTRIWAARTLFALFAKKKPLWLYYDCRNVFKDNGYYQFIHDFEKNDGIARYYVINDKIDRSSLFTPTQKKHLIRFGSIRHRILFFSAQKIITAYAEFNNYNPMFSGTWHYYSDLFHAEIVYLQHGVLHANLPWKYSNDRLNYVDREVISTRFEMENLTKNYNFHEKALIPAGMPRYDFMELSDPGSEKKVLFAPSWRKYIIGMDSAGNFFPTPKKFKDSDYFRETYAFLHDPRLLEALEKHDYILDFKLHPIFAEYADLYELDHKRVRIAEKSVNEFTYRIFITDFSSFSFDFVYLNKTIMYFLPDQEMFRAGLNDYRELDLPHEKGFGPLALTATDATDHLIALLERDGQAQAEYSEKMESFFYHHDHNCRDRIYEAVISSDAYE
ncbi:MAG: CDP-glycerol glycerophosphotransferase family protein, partial [Oscillospiraceae bacterium]|nr:CDP-glycerol glycerophosphotransferase family protein [Oscillospiraceae bacterium]